MLAKGSTYLSNSVWQLIEYVVRVISVIVIVIFIGRYLGPESFGKLNYAISVILIFSTASRFGLDSVLVRDLVRYPKQKVEFLSAALILVFCTSIFLWLLLTTISSLFLIDDSLSTLVLILSISIVFQVAFVFDYYFQSQVQSKYSTIAKSLAMSTSVLVKLYLVITKADLLYIAFAFALDQVLVFAFLLYAFYKKVNLFKEIKISRGLNVLQKLFREAVPFMFVSFLTILYLRIDQLLIQSILGSKSLGIYAAAIKIYEGWNIGVFIVINSLIPYLTNKKELSTDGYEKSFKYLIRVMVVIHIVLLTVLYFFQEEIILLTFGKEYINAAFPLFILIAGSLFTSFNYINTKYFLIEGFAKKMLFRSIVSIVLIVALNYLLLPLYGIDGAAISLLITVIISFYLLDFFDSDLRLLFYIKTKAIFTLGYK